MGSSKLLIADQSACERYFVRQTVVGLGFEILEIANGFDCIEAIISFEPDVILVEESLPGVNGMLIAERVRMGPTVSGTQVIVSLQPSETEKRKLAYESGADSIVYKPFDPGELRASFRNCFRLSEYWQNLNDRKSLERAYKRLSQTNAVMIEGWTRALDLRDNETEGHSLRVTELCVALSERLGFREPELTDIRYGAMLHDIGKIGIPDSILHKAGPLNAEERMEMQRHPEYAYSMLQGLEDLTHAVSIPYSHHEKWDGSGYPLGLAGTEIPFSARIFSVIDVYDALKSERPYKPAWSDEQTFNELRCMAGSHFDPSIVEAFIQMMYERLNLIAA